jgi:hypothetical protein
LGHGEQRRAKTQACPARRPISLASAYLVRVAGAPVELVGRSAIIFIASDGHIYTLYANGQRNIQFITAQTYGHNFGPDALARKQCRARVLAALGRALGVGPYGPVPPCPSSHAKSERTWSVLALAAVGALRAGALEAPVNELIDTTFGCCYPSSKAADVVPKGAPAIWHKSTACHLAHAL